MEEEETPSTTDEKEDQEIQAEEQSAKKVLNEEGPRNRDGNGEPQEEFNTEKEGYFLPPSQHQILDKLLFPIEDYKLEIKDFNKEMDIQE